ncbi:hypothetical protein P0R31_30535 [Bradyrhizobium yuanmingense]|uniref:hypothetical protein n=1 Tax=Bradyrhizobium yuanmingense TaxID=108015 RepID=UPI0023B9340E|nr:hypothetical protein [Bradyrhizobium yuanmingense]MDF0521587.1 hypothetical protein [Bradyrhizobium yuanmingense]
MSKERSRRPPPKSSAKRRASWRRYRERKKAGGWGRIVVPVELDEEFVEEVVDRKQLPAADRRNRDAIGKLARRLLQVEWAELSRPKK